MIGGFSANPHAWAVLLFFFWLCVAFVVLVAVYRRLRKRDRVFNWTVRFWLIMVVFFGVWFWVENEPRRSTSALFDDITETLELRDDPSLKGGRVHDFNSPCPGSDGRGFFTVVDWMRPDGEADRHGLPEAAFEKAEANARLLEGDGWEVSRIEGLRNKGLFIYAERGNWHLTIAAGEAIPKFVTQMTTDDCRGSRFLPTGDIDTQNADDPGSVTFVDSFTTE